MSDLLGLRPAPREAPRRRLPKVLAVLLVVLVLGGLVGGVVVGGRSLVSSLGGATSSSADYAGEGTGEVLVEVDEGDTAGAIATTLQEQDVVQSTGAFREAAAADPRSRSIQPGTYALRAQMSAAAALAMLLDPASRAGTKVVLPEGLSLAAALETIAATAGVPLEDLQAAVNAPASLGLPAYAEGQVEGFLFPATYEVEPGTTAVEVLTAMVDRYEAAAVDLDLEARAAALGRTPYEVLITASLIEKETAFPADRPKVARVVYNRLALGQMLQFDSTVNYLREEKKARLSIDDLKVESDYNPYAVVGRPPTPIGNPGEAAIEAALSPAEGDFVYFITTATDGSSLFTADYQEFLRAKAKAQAEGIY